MSPVLAHLDTKEKDTLPEYPAEEEVEEVDDEMEEYIDEEMDAGVVMALVIVALITREDIRYYFCYCCNYLCIF